MQALAFDLGGTYLRSAVIDCTGNLSVIQKQRIRSIADGETDSTIWTDITDAVVRYEMQNRPFVSPAAPIVFAFPGPVAANRSVLQAPTVAGIAAVCDIAGEIEAQTNRFVHLLNDVSSAAWYFASRTDAQRFLVVTVSSGIGSKLFFRSSNEGVLDHPPYAGEIGHCVVDDRPNAPICDCGGRGHLGAIASGRGIVRAARRIALADTNAFCSSKVAELASGDADRLENEKHLVPAALAGDTWAWSVIGQCTRPLARMILAITMACGLDHVFIIGGFAQALGDLYQQLLTQLLVEVSRYSVTTHLNQLVHVAAADEDACLKGCGAFIREKAAGL